MHTLDHVGEHFSVAGPLNILRPIQGPSVDHGGNLLRDQMLAAKYSDMVFTGTNVKEVAVKFYKDVKGRLPEYGRAPSDLKVLPGLVPIVGRTEEEARAKYAELNELVVSDYDLGPLSDKIGIDLRGFSLEDPLPDVSASETALHWADLARAANGREDITIRDLFYFFTVTVRGHLLVVGSARWRISSRNGSGMKRPMDSMCARLICRVDWICSWSWWYPSFSVVAYSASNMKAHLPGALGTKPPGEPI